MNTIYESTPVNGHKPTVLDLEAFDSFDYDTEQLTMPPRTKAEQDEKLAEAVEQLSVLMLRMDSRLQASESSKDRTALPNWLMPILFTVFLALVTFVYTTIDRRITDNKTEVLQQHLDDATEVRVLRTYVIQLTIEMNKRGMNAPPIPETKH